MDLRQWTPVVLTRPMQGMAPKDRIFTAEIGTRGYVIAQIGQDYIVEIEYGSERGTAWASAADLYEIEDDI